MNNTRVAIDLLAATPHHGDLACLFEIIGILFMGVLLDLIQSPVTELVVNTIDPPDARDLKGYRRKILGVRTRARVAKTLGMGQKAHKLTKVAEGMARCERKMDSCTAREWVEGLFDDQKDTQA